MFQTNSSYDMLQNIIENLCFEKFELRHCKFSICAIWGKREKNIVIGLGTSYKIIGIPNIPIPKNNNLNNVCSVFKLDIIVWKKITLKKFLY